MKTRGFTVSETVLVRSRLRFHIQMSVLTGVHSRETVTQLIRTAKQHANATLIAVTSFNQSFAKMDFHADV